MALKTELETEVGDMIRTIFSERNGAKIPEPADVKLGNDAVKLEAACLYTDMAGSTALVDGYKPWFAAKVYKTFLHCASKLIRADGGVITAFDGDRVMGVFLGDGMRTSAARCALRIHYAVKNIVNPALKRKYPDTNYELRHAVGVDVSSLFVARTGIRGSNDLVWVGRAANYAAKLCDLRDGTYTSFITEAVFDKMNVSSQKASNGTAMWQKAVWPQMGNLPIYRSGWGWDVDYNVT